MSEFKVKFNDFGVVKVTVPNNTRIREILIVYEDELRGELFRPEFYTEDGGKTFQPLWRGEF